MSWRADLRLGTHRGPGLLAPRVLRRAAVTALAAGAAFVSLALAGGVAPHPASVAKPEELTVVVLPHPDDEFQVWSQIERQQGATTVFVLLTRGEQSEFCDSQRGGGRWSDQCSAARTESWLSFFARMGAGDATIPSQLGPPSTVEVDPGPTSSSRLDGRTMVSGSTPQVWHDAEHRGALVAFDLGDGDLTVDEVRWALGAVLEDREAFGLPDLAVGRVIGAYAYGGDAAGCYRYAHPDHVAVAAALATVDFGARAQLSSSCSLDPAVETAFTSTVSQGASDAAFGPQGAFPAAYGWLGPWPLAQDQSKLFHREQAFVVR